MLDKTPPLLTIPRTGTVWWPFACRLWLLQQGKARQETRLKVQTCKIKMENEILNSSVHLKTKDSLGITLRNTQVIQECNRAIFGVAQLSIYEQL